MIVLDSITLAVFMVLLITICIIAIVSSLGWLIESQQRERDKKRMYELEEEKKINKLCEDFKKNDYSEYMKKLEENIKKERGKCTSVRTAARHLMNQ